MYVVVLHTSGLCVCEVLCFKKKKERDTRQGAEKKKRQRVRERSMVRPFISLFISRLIDDDCCWTIYTHTKPYTHTHGMIYVIIIIYDISSDLRHTVSGGFSETRLLFTREREREREIFILSKTLNSFHQSLF